MSLVIIHKHTHQVAGRMNMDHKRPTDLKYKQRLMDKPIIHGNLKYRISKNKSFDDNLNNNTFPHSYNRAFCEKG